MKEMDQLAVREQRQKGFREDSEGQRRNNRRGQEQKKY